MKGSSLRAVLCWGTAVPPRAQARRRCSPALAGNDMNGATFKPSGLGDSGLGEGVHELDG